MGLHYHAAPIYLIWLPWYVIKVTILACPKNMPNFFSLPTLEAAMYLFRRKRSYIAGGILIYYVHFYTHETRTNQLDIKWVLQLGISLIWSMSNALTFNAFEWCDITMMKMMMCKNFLFGSCIDTIFEGNVNFATQHCIEKDMNLFICKINQIFAFCSTKTALKC